MSGWSKRRHGDSPVVDVADVFADDALIDTLLSESSGAGPVATGPAGIGAPPTGAGAAGFGGREVGNGTHGEDPLIELFDIWRDEIASSPLPPVPAVRHASHAVAAGRHRQQRTARPAMLIAAAICALLIGSAAVGSRTARPGDTLWGLASVLWSDRLDSVRSLSEVKDALAEVQSALDAGRPDAAREALMRATVQLGHVDDLDMPASIPATVQKLWVDVIPEAERRSTQATASAAAAAADVTTAPPDGSPSTASAAGTPVATTPLLSTILEAIIASNQPQVSTDSSTPSGGSSAPVAAVGPPTIADLSTPPGAATDPSTESPIDPTTDAPTETASPTPTPPPVTTDPAPQTSPAVPVDPTSSGDQTATENSAPSPPPASTEPSTDDSGPSVETAPPTATAPSDPAASGSDGKPVDPAADQVTATP